MRDPAGRRTVTPMTTIKTTNTTATRTPLETVQAVYAAFGDGDMDTLLTYIDADVDWSAQVDAPGGALVPMLQNGRGHGAVLRYFSGVALMDITTFEPRQIVADGDTVLVLISIAFTHRTTGKSVVTDEIHRWVVGADGLIVLYRPFVDTAALIEAFRP
jgi:ketosteroid isomerase-like protein